MQRRMDQRRCLNKESIMKSKHFLNGLALLGALVILVGVTAAANNAFAGDTGSIEIHGLAHSSF
jgi:hypothetical protein